MRLFVIVASLVALAACQQAQPVVYNPYPPLPQPQYHAPVKKVRPADRRDKIDQTVPAPAQLAQPAPSSPETFSKMEDRFISTHSMDQSIQELGKSKESIEDRLKQLDQK